MKGIFLIVFFALSFNCHAQIEQVEVKAKPSARIEIPTYDSLYKNYHIHGDFTTEEINKLRELIGQELTIIPRSKKYTKYRNFDFNRNEAFFSQADLNGTRTNYNNHDGEKLRIKDIIVEKFSFDGGKISRVIFELLNEKAGNKLYWLFYWGGWQSHYNIPSPLLVLGYYEKIKLTHIGKDFIFINSKSNKFIDNNTGNDIDVSIGSDWKCTKIAYGDYSDDPYQKLTAICRDNAGREIAIEFSKLNSYFITKDQHLKNIEAQRLKLELEKAEQERIAKQNAEEERQRKIANAKRSEDTRKKSIANIENKKRREEDLIKKYGYSYGTAIANGKVIIGMNKEMCIAAWGKPSNINRTITANVTQEQWVYSLKTYLYFDKFGKLVTIQD